ncbi:MAG: YqiJ family protein [Burkholderiaceae bacterium]|jgi:membrane protein implicated in regulation of membrane protease activity|nr:YqiJ family protein [Burkholderiaceae bacterium]
MTLFTAAQAWPFGAALALMLSLSVLEGVGLLIAFSPSQMLDSLVPDAPDGIDGPLGWLHLGKVPMLVLLILFLTGFALSGYLIQGVALSLSHALLPAWVASIPAAFAGLSLTSALGGLLARVIPRDESSAVSEQSLIGRAGVVVRGIARTGLAAEAKVRDMHGHAHYVMVEPDLPEHVFEEGASVLLVKKSGVSFRCIPNPHPELL